jgi:hypothetical protein
VVVGMVVVAEAMVGILSGAQGSLVHSELPGYP